MLPASVWTVQEMSPVSQVSDSGAGGPTTPWQGPCLAGQQAFQPEARATGECHRHLGTQHLRVHA
jgi:hypothetical protein